MRTHLSRWLGLTSIALCAVGLLAGSDGAETVLFDVQDATHHLDDPAPNGFEDFQRIKLYTSGPLVCALRERPLPLEAWWDDFVLAAAP